MNCARARVTIPLFFILISLIMFAFQVHGNPDELTVYTNKISYNLGDSVNIYGALTLGGSPVTNGLVAVQVQYSGGNPLMVRTLSTGTPPPPWKVMLTSFFSCDMSGNPVSIFTRGSFASFKLSVQNTDPVLSRSVVATISVIDAENFPIGIQSFEMNGVPPGQSLTWGASLKIPEDANTGSTVAYANVYTKWPKNDGFPYCPEVSVMFTITSKAGSSAGGASTSSGNPQPNSVSAGSYDLVFTLPNSVRSGLYDVYARARYNAAADTRVDVIWLYTDINRDDVVNIVDVTIAAQAFGSQIGDPGWSGIVDQNGDGTINIIDISLIALDFGRSRA